MYILRLENRHILKKSTSGRDSAHLSLSDSILSSKTENASKINKSPKKIFAISQKQL